jgi:hypothetical protein
MNVTFTLTGGSASTAAGPFNISGTTDSNVVSELATGIEKAQLLTGHTIESVNDAITGGTIASTGTCNTTTPWYVTPPAESATLAWSFTETGGARGEMNLYVNGSVEVTRLITSTGTLTVNVGDTINVEVNCDECGSNYSNAYCGGIIDDADCVQADIANIFTSVYTVQIADIGTTLDLNTFARCDSACL